MKLYGTSSLNPPPPSIISPSEIIEDHIKLLTKAESGQVEVD